MSSYGNAKEVPWSMGLFDCFKDTRTCCISCWCPCVTFGQVAEIVGKGDTSAATSGGLYTVLACLGGCSCFYSYLYRSKMRKEHHLKGSTTGDFLIHCCCEPCALTQEYNELQARGFDVKLGWEGNMEKRNREMAAAATAPAVESSMQR